MKQNIKNFFSDIETRNSDYFYLVLAIIIKIIVFIKLDPGYSAIIDLIIGLGMPFYFFCSLMDLIEFNVRLWHLTSITFLILLIGLLIFMILRNIVNFLSEAMGRFEDKINNIN